MKKALKIGGIILGIILAALLIIFIFFPGLFTYIKVKSKYNNIDRCITEFKKVEVPDDFKTYTIGNLKISVPEDYKWNEENAVFSSPSLEEAVSIIEYEDKDEEYSFQNDNYNKSEFLHLFESIGKPVADDGMLTIQDVWYCEQRISAKDCLKLRGRDKDVFCEIASSKDNMIDTWRVCSFIDDDYFAYLTYGDFAGKLENSYWIIYMPDYNIFIMETNNTIAKQIISSIELK
jgi:hypothetical protein